MVLKVTQIAPEVIFVKPEVKFLPLEMAAMRHLWVFNALKELLRTQKRQNQSFCASKLENVICGNGSDLNIPQIYFNGP